MAKDNKVKIPVLPPLVRKSLESGLITDLAVGENRRPETSCSEAVNFDFQTIGPAKTRAGILQIGNALSGNVLGLHQFTDTLDAGAYTQLIMVNGTVAYYLSGSTWATLRTSLTAGSKARFADLLNYTFMVNGADPTAVWSGNTGTGFVTTGSASGAPVGKYIDTFQSRMWIAGNPSYPDRVFWSTTPLAEVTQTVTWSTDPVTGTQWTDVSPNDGQSITALKKYRTALLIFKQNRIYRASSIVSVDLDPYFAVGTYSQESVVETKAGLFFHHSSGFYQYNVYGVVQQISIPIQDIILAIPSSAYSSVAGWIDPDGDHINWSVGTVTYGGVTYQNMVVRYRISTQVWTHRSYPSQFLCSTPYNDGTALWNVVGDNAGKAHLYNSGTTDNGTPISYSLVHRWENFDGLLSTRKTVETILFNHYRGAMANVNYQVEGDTQNDWTKRVGRGQFDAYNTGFNSVGIKARKMRIRISGSNVGGPIEYHGYEAIGATDELLTYVTK
jgi:hypothetical protein